MKYNPLGTTGIEVSIIGLGTVKLGRDQGVKYPGQFKIPADKEALLLIQSAHEQGVNLIDTAPAYGNSEERLGHLLKNRRKNWILCSKVGEEFDNGASRFDFTRSGTIRSIEQSLKRLQTDYIDILLIHSDGNDLHIINETEMFGVLSELKQQGKIRAFGMSTKTTDGSMLAAKKSDVVMLTYNLKERDEAKTIEFCHENKTGVFIKKAFASGHAFVDAEDPVQASFDFILENPGVSSIVVGTISQQHLRHNIDCALRAIKKSAAFL